VALRGSREGKGSSGGLASAFQQGRIVPNRRREGTFRVEKDRPPPWSPRGDQGGGLSFGMNSRQRKSKRAGCKKLIRIDRIRVVVRVHRVGDPR